jgi:Tfp pilus assembly protein PilV
VKQNLGGFTRQNFVKQNLGGFTLLEVIFALFVMTIAILGVFSLVQQTTGFLPLVRDKFVASYLAQEGIEIVRNIRDTNRLQRNPWNQGLNDGALDCSGGCEADYQSASLSVWQSRFLKIDPTNKFYNYSSGDNTKFRRKITATSSGVDILMISINVSWTEKDRSHEVSVIEHLYNAW